MKFAKYFTMPGKLAYRRLILHPALHHTRLQPEAAAAAAINNKVTR
jgi:hypothetical protein